MAKKKISGLVAAGLSADRPTVDVSDPPFISPSANHIIHCAGGCGKTQAVRKPPNLAYWDAVGCGNCEGWRALQDRPVPDGMVCEVQFQAIAGFHAFRLRVATMEERASVERAQHLLAVAIGLPDEQP